MKNKVYALGNALVDYEYKVSDEWLASTELTKGCAKTSVTLQEQEHLITSLEDNNISLIKKAGGGSAANTVFAIAALGGSSSISCRVNDDSEGRFYLQNLTDAGVKTSIKSLIACSEPTGNCLILITPDAERTLQSYLGSSTGFSVKHIDESLLHRAEYIYIEGYLATSKLAIEAIKDVKQTARENDIKLAVSFADPSMVDLHKKGLLNILNGGVDIIFCNTEEATSFTDKATVQEAITELHKSATLVVITMGSEGACISEKGKKPFTTLAPKIDNVIDTNGAGDNFAGAFMYGITNDLSLEKSAQLAVQVAGQLVSKFGPRMKKEEYQKVLADFRN